MKTDLTHAEMQVLFAERVENTLGMTVEEYRKARRGGVLPETPQTIALAVFSGEASSGQSAAEGPHSQGGKNSVSGIHTASGSVRASERSLLGRTISGGLRKLRIFNAR